MSSPKMGRDVAINLLDAMRLPVEGASDVRIDLPRDEFATVSVTYFLTAEHLQLLGKLMEEDKASGVEG